MRDDPMGLAVQVGMTTREARSSGGRYAADLKCMTRLLRDAGLPDHREPLPQGAGWAWAAEIGSSAGLHLLRRLAAGLALSGELPAPLASARAATAPELAAYHAGRAVGQLRAVCDHLLFHSDAEGYYVPVDFSEVLNADGVQPLTGDYLGSSIRLGHECRVVAQRLELPTDLDFDFGDDGEWKRLERATVGVTWHRYPAEAFVCAVLLRACAVSVEHGAVIVFG